jgi:hypothetical protein
MPQLDTYYLLKNAYGENGEIVENYDPNPTARSLRFNSSWSGKGGGTSNPPPSSPERRHSRPSSPERRYSRSSSPERRYSRSSSPDRHYDDDYDRRRRYNRHPYYDYGNMYYPQLQNNYSYLPYFYNMYTYSPYNLNYSQYIPTMNMFWDSINTSVLNYPEYPGLSDIDRMKRFIIDLPTFIPCNDACKSFMKLYIKEQISNLDSICQNKKTLVDFFQNLRHQFYIKFDII